MDQLVQFDPEKVPKYKVELHVHLDGAVRLKTIWELAQKKGIKLEANTLEDLYKCCQIKHPSTLADFLKPFDLFLPVIVGDPEAIERIAYEFCEDASRQKVVYSEVRYCPHLLSTSYGVSQELKVPPLMPRDVVMCVNKGLSRGSAAFNLTVRSILCCFRGHSEWSNEILDLCIEFSTQGVVGIDLAGDEEKLFASDVDIDVYNRAYTVGVHRTIHASEAGPWENFETALHQMHAERIGHGYHVMENEDAYNDAKFWGIHFEVCPYSSLLTGSVHSGFKKHPIVRFAEDNVSFSISRDDPTLTQKTLDDEYELLRKLGLKEFHIVKANLNAAKKCFLPHDERMLLEQYLREIYGFDPNDAVETTGLYIAPSALRGSGDA